MARRKKIRPVEPGQFGPLPFHAILSPDGKFYRAPHWQHEKVGFDLTGDDWDTCLSNGWLRVNGSIVSHPFFHGDPTQPQLDAITELAGFMGWSVLDCFDAVEREKAARFLQVEVTPGGRRARPTQPTYYRKRTGD